VVEAEHGVHCGKDVRRKFLGDNFLFEDFKEEDDDGIGLAVSNST